MVYAYGVYCLSIHMVVVGLHRVSTVTIDRPLGVVYLAWDELSGVVFRMGTLSHS